jgi:hypothetical protein
VGVKRSSILWENLSNSILIQTGRVLHVKV